MSTLYFTKLNVLMHLGSVDNKLGYCQSATSVKKRPGVKVDAHKANFWFVQLRNMTDRLLRDSTN